MADSSGFHFVIDRSGAPAYLDSAETLSFRRAEGDYSAPDRSRATVRIIAPGFVTDVNVISVADTQWETNVLTGQWQELPPDWGFNPTILFDADVGLQAILSSDLTELQDVTAAKQQDGPEPSLYAVSGIATGERLFRMSGGLIGPGEVDVILWIAPESFELHRVLLTEAGGSGEEATFWQVDFDNFDQKIGIEPPELE
jgi:lipoprotein LprG